MNTQILVGNNLSILVTASELIKKGCSVTIYTDGKPLGGFFRGIAIEDHLFDVGMIYIEKHENYDKDFQKIPKNYNPNVRNDWIQYGNHVSDWIGSYLDLKKVITPSTLIEGKVIPDYLISNRYEFLQSKNLKLIKNLSRSNINHASNKATSLAFDTLKYSEAAIYNHGTIIHNRFIEPFISKLSGHSSDSFLARFHRALWAPLYYPETINKVISTGVDNSLKEYPFYTSNNGASSQLVLEVIKQLNKSGLLKCIDIPLKSMHLENSNWKICLSNGESSFTEKLVLGLSNERVLDLFQLPNANTQNHLHASVSILFTLVEAKQIKNLFGCLMIVDDEYHSYRITNHDFQAGIDAQWHRVTIEANPSSFSQDDDSIEDVLKSELIALLGIKTSPPNIKKLKFLRAKNAITLPSKNVIDEGLRQFNEFMNLGPNILLTGSLLGYGVSSQNDQIIQGLKNYQELH
jgi:hypothetical protein